VSGQPWPRLKKGNPAMRAPTKQLGCCLAVCVPVFGLFIGLSPAAGASTAARTARASTVQAAGLASRHARPHYNARRLAAARLEALKFLKQQHPTLAQVGPSRPTAAKNGGITALTRADAPNWSGYADTGKGYGSVSGSWTEPGISCAAGENSEDAFWVGIDGYNGSTVEQAGTEAECNNGHPFYDTWWEMFPSGPVIVGTSLAPGDTIHASVTRSGSTYTLSVTDTNAPPDSFSVPFTRGGEANATAEWIAEGSTNQLSDFHRWVLSDAVVDGGAISSHPDNEVTMTDSSGAVEAQPTALNSADNGFTVFWVRGT
jgi:hypothetical protein